MSTVNVPLCPFHAATGLYCPLCGSLRGVGDLAHGHVMAALGSNLLLVVTLPLLAWGAVVAGVGVGVGEVRGPWTMPAPRVDRARRWRARLHRVAEPADRRRARSLAPGSRREAPTTDAISAAIALAPGRVRCSPSRLTNARRLGSHVPFQSASTMFG